MNILPKKRWHVRTKENIARVRRDEAQAAEEEKERKARAQKAETEARINLLREKSRRKYDGRDKTTTESTSKNPEVLEHVNFFKDIEDGKIDYNKPNVEHEAEKKEEREKYEKQIGYLTYLGQDTNEATGKKNWYELPRRLTDAEPSKEVQEKKKSLHDPLVDVRRYLSIMGCSSSRGDTGVSCEASKKRKLEADGSSDEGTSKKNKKRRKKSKKCKYDKREKPDVDLERLRAKRLLREQSEKLKTEALLAKVRGEPLPVVKSEESRPTIRQKYNSQFCPEIARQNAERTPRH
ncbi:leukocyte receptor cluster member 1 [Diachasma alloeum]|uniref:leukocyte receptor cluster member 1 n=1 Tax=Diachasma alloeum TaxID=454923 RepID=UPI0007384C72|nr:leukocyte receptor cluster member 1 [Diachasma alloeum]